MHKTDKFGGTANIIGLRPYSRCDKPMEEEKPSHLTAFVTVVLLFAIVGLGWFACVALP